MRCRSPFFVPRGYAHDQGSMATSDNNADLMFAGWAMQEMDDEDRRRRDGKQDGCCSGDIAVGCLWLLGILLVCGACGNILG